MRYADIRGDIKMELHRQNKNISWLAENTGYDEHSVQQWLSGGKEPKINIVIRMLSALGMQLKVEHT